MDVELKLDEFVRAFKETEKADKCISKFLKEKTIEVLDAWKESHDIKNKEDFHVSVYSRAEYIRNCEERGYEITIVISVSRSIPLNCINKIGELLPYPCDVVPEGAAVNLNFKVLNEV